MLTLGDHADGLDDWYGEEARKQFRAILEGDRDVFLTNDSEWGVDYTLARPVADSSGKHYGVLCVDVSKDQLIETVTKTIIINIALVVGLVFMENLQNVASATSEGWVVPFDWVYAGGMVVVPAVNMGKRRPKLVYVRSNQFVENFIKANQWKIRCS